jgi:hypothetical protein
MRLNMVLYFDVPCAGLQGSDFNFSIVFLFICLMVRMFNCSDIQLFGCSIIQLPNWINCLLIFGLRDASIAQRREHRVSTPEK